MNIPPRLWSVPKGKILEDLARNWPKKPSTNDSAVSKSENRAQLVAPGGRAAVVAKTEEIPSAIKTVKNVPAINVPPPLQGGAGPAGKLKFKAKIIKKTLDAGHQEEQSIKNKILFPKELGERIHGIWVNVKTVMGGGGVNASS